MDARDVVRRLQRAHETEEVLAGAVGLVADGRLLECATVGTLEFGGPAVSESSLFEVGSITKLLTSASAIRLMQRGALDLDAKVVDLIPGLVFDDTRRGRDVTVRHLLSHCSGLPSAGRDWGPTGPSALFRFATEDLAHHVFHAEPGEVGCYSSTALSLAGLALETVAGQPFPDLMASEIWEPAGMEGAGYPPNVDVAHVVWPHHRHAGSWSSVLRLADNPSGYPSGFLMASLEDLVSLAVSLLDGSLVGPDWLDLIGSDPVPRWMRHAPTALGRVAAGFGLGCFIGHWNGQRVVRHPGGQLASICSLDLLPDSGAAIILLTNGADSRLVMDLLELCYQAVAGPPSPIESPSVAAVPEEVGVLITGDYIDVDQGGSVRIANEEGQLVLRDASSVSTLAWLGEGAWVANGDASWVPIGIPLTDGPAARITIWGSLYLRSEVGSWEPGGSGAQLTGVYRDSFWPDVSSDLDVREYGGRWTVTAEGHTTEGRWIGAYRLLSGHGLVEFAPDGSQLRLGNATRFIR